LAYINRKEKQYITKEKNMEKGRILELAVANMRYMYLGTVNRYEGIVFFFFVREN
jgi:hypothetical protein